MSFPRYPSYKPSGVEWLGEVPEHWGVLQSRRMFKARREAAKEGAIMLTASQRYGMISQAEFVEREGRRVVEVIQGKDNLIQVEPDDFVISMRSFQGGLEWCRLSGSTSFHYVPVTPIKHVVPSFFAHLMKSDRYISALRATTNLIRDGQEIRYSNFVQVPLPIIPESEQIAISTFLNRETAKIDALIAEQQRLVELLQEKRQAVISHAVTKGLNPDAPMKDSGVEWLGEVPEHWEVRPLKHLANVQTGMAKGKDLEGIETVDIPYLRVANVQDGYLDLDEVHLLSVPVTSIDRFLLKEGDVLMNEGGDFDKLGRGCIWSGEIDPCVHQNHVFAVRPHSVSGEWLNVYTTSNAANSYFISRAKQSTNLASISSTNLMGLPVPLPPPEEARGILVRLNALVKETEDLKISATQATDLLQERRTALISATVTGQIDVRGLVADGCTT
jgi:type I restriction enzyme S subunit